MDDEGVMPETNDLAVQTFACVWDALADSPAEAVAMRLRSDLLSAIQQTVASWGMTRATAARRLELTGPRLDELLRGSLGKFSFDDLIQLATRAGLDVRMQIEPAVTG
jgi:predicted XRE-type DNA-binding protein